MRRGLRIADIGENRSEQDDGRLSNSCRPRLGHLVEWVVAQVAVVSIFKTDRNRASVYSDLGERNAALQVGPQIAMQFTIDSYARNITIGPVIGRQLIDRRIPDVVSRKDGAVAQSRSLSPCWIWLSRSDKAVNPNV